MKKGKRYLCLFLAVLTVISLMPLSAFGADTGVQVPGNSSQEVNIPDAAFKSALNKLIDGDRAPDHAITAGELAGIKSLYLNSDDGVTDIEGIQYMTELTSLYIGNDVENISYISDLEKLSSLTLRYNSALTDLTVLGEKDSLTYLNIYYSSSLTSLNGIEKFPNLEELIVFRCASLSDISALDNVALPELVALDLEGPNMISDISPLEDYTSLKELNMEKIEITDSNRTAYRSAIRSLTGIETLYMPYCEIGDEDTVMFKDLNYLNTLVLNANNLTSTAFCDDLPTGIETLGLYGNEISDMDNLSRLTNLKVLGLGDNQVTDFSFTKNLTELTNEDIRHAEGDEDFPFRETYYYSTRQDPTVPVDGKIVIENPYKNPDGKPISFEKAALDTGFGTLSYDQNNNTITVSNVSNGEILISVDYDLPVSDGEVKVGRLRIAAYAQRESLYTLTYDWESSAPAGQSLPYDSTSYSTVDAAMKAIDTTFAEGMTVNGEKDGKSGIWTFSGWEATVNGHTINVTGSWTFAENPAPHRHQWSDTTYVWSDDMKTCTATRVCALDQSHVETETVKAVSQVTTPATESSMGKTTYTAAFTNTWAQAQTKTLENIPQLESSEPSDNSDPTVPADDNAPKTGDSNNMVIWLIICAAAVIVVVLCIIKLRKRS